MRLFATLFVLVPCIIFTSAFSSASVAQDHIGAEIYFPSLEGDGEFTGTYSVREFDLENETLNEYQQTTEEWVEAELYTDPWGFTAYVYEINNYPLTDTGLLTFHSLGDTASISTAQLIDPEILATLGLDPDEFQRVPVIRLDLDETEQVVLFEQLLTVEIPDSLRDMIDLPSGVSLGEDLDLKITFRNTRLENRHFDNDLGVFESIGFKTGITIEATVEIIVQFIGTFPITFTVVDNYGPEFFFAEGKGLVFEKLEATRVSITLQNDFINIDEELATLDGREVEKTSLVPRSETSTEEITDLPATLQIKPNYPNPFNPGTNLQFELRESAVVTIEIFDIQGRRTDVIRAGSFSPGLHAVYYDAARLASGTYMYRITAREAGNGSDAISQTAAFTLIR